MVAVETGQFGNAQSGRKQEFQDGFVAEGLEALAHGCLHQLLYLREFEKVNLAVGGFSDLDLFGSQRQNILLGQVFEKGAQDDRLVSLGILFERTAAPVSLAVEIDPVLPDFFSRNIFRDMEVAPSKKGFKRATIAFNSAGRPIHLDLEVVKETFCVFLEGSHRYSPR